MSSFLCFVDGQELPSGYDKYYFANERCFDSIAECERRNVPYEVLTSGLLVENNLQIAEDYLLKTKSIITDFLVDVLNKYHHTNYSYESWNILLNAWLTRYLPAYYEKYLRLNRLTNECEYTSFEQENVFVPVDYSDSDSVLLNNSLYHGYIYSCLVNGIPRFSEKTNRVAEEKISINSSVARRKTRGYYKSKAYRFLDSLQSKLTRQDYWVVMNNCYLPNGFAFSLSQKNKHVHVYFTDYLNNERVGLLGVKADPLWRNQVIDIHEKSGCDEVYDEFRRFILLRVIKDIPIAYVEGFHYLEKRSKSIYLCAINPKAVLYAGGAAADELFKVYLMKVRQGNAVLCDVQHGGNYGIECNEIMHYEFEISDKFYTWGWENPPIENCDFIPMPAAKLLTLKKREPISDGKILFVNYIEEKNIIQMTHSSVTYHNDLWSEILFLKNLDSTLKNSLVVRLYKSDYGWGLKDKLMEIVPDLKYDEISDYYESVRAASLVVMSRISTTTLEALYMGCPILALQDKSIQIESAKPYIEELKRVGVIVETWEQMATTLTNISNDIDNWWNDAERQRAVNKFKDRFVYMPENAEEIWEKEILSYCSDN